MTHLRRGAGCAGRPSGFRCAGRVPADTSRLPLRGRRAVTVCPAASRPVISAMTRPPFGVSHGCRASLAIVTVAEPSGIASMEVLPATWHSTRAWWRVCSGTRAAYHRCTRATSSFVGHADRGVHARYTHVLDEAHRQRRSRWLVLSAGRGTGRDHARLFPVVSVPVVSACREANCN